MTPIHPVGVLQLLSRIPFGAAGDTTQRFTHYPDFKESAAYRSAGGDRTPGAQVRLPHTVRQRPTAGIQEDRQHDDGVDRCAMEGRHARAAAIGKICNAARSGQRRFCVANGVRRQRIA